MSANVNGNMDNHMGWISFSDQLPDRTHTHPMILVTNNIEARDSFGHMSHIWLVSMIHTHETQHRFNNYVIAEAGEITAFENTSDTRIRNLTHWRPAVPEEKGWTK